MVEITIPEGPKCDEIVEGWVREKMAKEAKLKARIQKALLLGKILFALGVVYFLWLLWTDVDMLGQLHNEMALVINGSWAPWAENVEQRVRLLEEAMRVVRPGT